MGVALISFFFTGAADQSKIENVPLQDLLINRGSVENWTGVRGAYLADLLIPRRPADEPLVRYRFLPDTLLLGFARCQVDELEQGVALETFPFLCVDADMVFGLFRLHLYPGV